MVTASFHGVMEGTDEGSSRQAQIKTSLQNRLIKYLYAFAYNINENNIFQHGFQCVSPEE